MQLTLFTDYALRTLMYLGAREDPKRVVPIQDVAESYGISRHYLLKVAAELARLGYVDAVRGRSGGIRLAKGLESVRLGDLVRQTEPERGVLACVGQEESDCPIHEACGFRSILAEATDAFYAVLDRYTVADAVGPNRRRLSELLGLPAPPPPP